MLKEKMLSDLEFFLDKLERVHVLSVNGFSEKQKIIIEKVEERIELGLSENEFLFALNEIACSFNDAHTKVEIANLKQKVLDIGIRWIDGDVYIVDDSDDFKCGDKIISIGGKNKDELMKMLRNVIAAENDYWLSDHIYVFRLERYLKHFNMLDENDFVEITILREDKKLTYNSQVKEKVDSYRDEGEYKFVKYSIDKSRSLAILELESCIYNDKYISMVKEMFEKVKEENIGNILIDLRENMGGNSGVATEFIKYLDVDEYKVDRVDKRVSNEVLEVFEWEKEIGYFKGDDIICENNKNEDLAFKGNIYIFTSNITFSSATDFAVLFRDNNLAKIVGEPTGGKPSSLGDIMCFELPNCNVSFSVSWKLFHRPDDSKEDELTLFPDVIIKKDIKHILSGKDIQLELFYKELSREL
ncbi:MAG: S41 family peptidase [Clostridia bacterium]|nr:S41 family peptidase [Clostridia bacterium]